MLKTTGGFVIPSLLSPRGGRPPSLTRWRTHFFKRGTVFWPARSWEEEFSNRIRTIAATHDVVTRRRVMSRHRMADGKSSRHPGCNGSCMLDKQLASMFRLHRIARSSTILFLNLLLVYLVNTTCAIINIMANLIFTIVSLPHAFFLVVPVRLPPSIPYEHELIRLIFVCQKVVNKIKSYLGS